MVTEFNKKIAQVQSEIKAPKNLYNDFGKYSYRSAEAILEVAKPILHKYDLVLTITDDIIQLGDRFYVKATSTITDGENSISTTAFARETLDKKGMDEAQVTGSASSYARKYSLNGIFCLDDNKDPDSMDNRESTPTAPTQDNAAVLKSFCASMKTQPGVDIKDLTDWYTYWNKRIESGDFKGDINPVKLWASHTNRNKS